MQAPLPVITTRREDRRDRGYLAWVAIANEVAHLELDTAPINGSTHSLEIHVAGFPDPLIVLAEPVGEPTEKGFPLRLRPVDEDQADLLRAELFSGAGAGPAKPETLPPPRTSSGSFPPPPGGSERPPLSAGHRSSLARVGEAAHHDPRVPERREPGSLTGRLLGDGRFAAEQLIGAGASGEVYRGMHTALRRPIAIKVLHPALQHNPDYCIRFYSEALAASQLDHRNVLRIIDYGQEPDGLLYIAMELLEGESLEEILQREGPIPYKRLVNLIAQACAGLAHAHEAGVVHRDVKPENIVVVKRRDDEGNTTEFVKVCDFGIAHWQPVSTEEGDDEATLVNRPDASQVVGTPAYMAPEQIRNETVDARTDVYALGVVLYELATGYVPFDGEAPMQILMRHINEEPVPPSKRLPGLDPNFERIVLKAMQKDPAKRQPDMRVLRAELKSLVDDDTTSMTGQHRQEAVKNLILPNQFIETPADALAKLASADPASRAVGIESLARAIRSAMIATNIPVATQLVAWLEAQAKDPAVKDDERDAVERAMRSLRDPQASAALATAVIQGKIERIEEAVPLLAAAGPGAAQALIEARKKGHPTLDDRGRFVACLKALGLAVLPALAAALETLVPLATRADEVLAEDLLRSIPEVRSDPAGEITVRFVRLDKPLIGVVALATTAAVWRERAQPLLIGVLDSTVDMMRLAALKALSTHGTIDDWVLERLARILLAQVPAGDELRIKAAESFALAIHESRGRAVTFLQQRLQPGGGLMSSMRQVFAAKENPWITLAMARSLFTLDPTGARVVLERLVAARPELRAEVDKILLPPRT